jgi:serine/threonine protein kinase
MLLPRGDEYLTAVQNPRSAFSDTELKDCAPEVDQFGIPKPYSGGFTATFHLLNQSREWAVRCFTRAISDLQQRYAAIDRFLARTNERFLVETFYLSQGIRIAGQWYPVIKMRWVKGDTLNSFIAKSIGNVGRTKQLVPEFLALVRRLQQLGIAHGDLQHGNILVRDGKLCLIDYDGMFLPKLARLKTNEIGHPNYQHPGRNASHYGPAIDRFSSIVIYLGLRAISESPKLWSKYDDSENILFRAEDLVNPGGSALLRELSALSPLSADVVKFHGVCQLPFDEIPDLETFISGRFRHPDVASARVATSSAPPAPALQVAASSALPTDPRRQNVVLDGANLDALGKHVGQRVEVVGVVSHFHASRNSLRRPYVLLNFGVYPEHTFTLVLRSAALKTFQSSGLDPQTLVGKRIKVSGVMASYKGKPQMEVDGPAQLHVLGGGVAVPQVVGRAAAATAARSQPQHSGGSPESIFEKLYGGQPAGTSPAKMPPRQAPKARAPGARHTNTQASPILALIVAAVLLGVIGWALWPIWGFVNAH